MTTIAHRRTTTSKMRQRLTLQQEVETPDNAGGFTRTWQNVADLWAEFVQLRGLEVVDGQQLQSEFTHRILVRHRCDIVPGMRLAYENRFFLIRYVLNVNEKNDTLELFAEEGVIA